ncbi:type I methionyl aminopeptidase [Candidatus Dependentiae bacterium]|nr:type I methionyl aminopeptidase [Candidatus Dependentiae bacterium]
MAIIEKSPEEIRVMREAGIIAGETLKITAAYLKSGISSKELDIIAEKHIRGRKAVPAFLGYRGFPASLCVSINEEIVHGIPNRNRILKKGDVVSLDVGVFKNGFYCDTAATFVVEKSEDSVVNNLIETTKKALYESIKFAVAGRNLYDISFAIQSISESSGFSVVRDYTGHGIGRKLHEEPFILNYVPNIMLRSRGQILKKGYVLAIEPMLNIGGHQTEVLEDRWTVVTRDRKISAHFEHTVAVTDGKPVILTEV